VGEQLSAPLRISCPPRWTLRQGAMHPPAPSSPSFLGAFTTNPAIRVVRGGEGRRSYSLPPASADHDAAHLSDRRLFSVEDADPPRIFSILEEPSPCRVDFWHSRCHAQAHPSRNPIPPDVPSSITLLADGEVDFTCESEDFSFALPVKARRAKTREHLSSYRAPASD
jgi:hypothetical protein